MPKISQLPAGVALTGVEEFAAVQAGATVGLTATQIAALALGTVNPWTAAQAFGGGATAPTRPTGDNTTNIATTAFVQGLISIPEASGCVGDGVTDDTLKFQAALNALGPGQALLCRRKYLIGSITVPANVSIVGEGWYPSVWVQGGGPQANPYLLNSQLRLKTGATITMSDGSALENLLIIHAGMTLPATTNTLATALVAGFADTAITAQRVSVRLERLMVLGFTRLCSITNPGGTGSTRAVIRDIMGDNTNGIMADDAADVSHFSGCHMWPFLTAGVPSVTDANLQRSGVAYYFQNVDDWFTVEDCFSYGYLNGFALVDTSNVSFIRCQADYTPTSGGGNTGFFFTQTTAGLQYASMFGCFTVGQNNSILWNPVGASPGQDTLQVIGCTLVPANGGVAINHTRGFLIAADNLIQGATATGISLASTVAGGDIHDNRFVISTPITNSYAGTALKIHDNAGYNPVGVTAAANVGASPATITAGPSPETHYLNQSGTNTATVAKGTKQIAALKDASTYYPVHLGPNESYIVTWLTTQPTYTKDVH